jgi:hypothetical protein
LAKLGSDECFQSHRNDQQCYSNFVLFFFGSAVAKFSTWELRTCKEKKEKKKEKKEKKKEKKRRKSLARDTPLELSLRFRKRKARTALAILLARAFFLARTHSNVHSSRLARGVAWHHCTYNLAVHFACRRHGRETGTRACGHAARAVVHAHAHARTRARAHTHTHTHSWLAVAWRGLAWLA